jgi:hypothetical protein
MSIEVDDLAALRDTYADSITAFQRTFGPLACISDPFGFVPGPCESDERLDAWADYLIAKRRYERALVMSRRGVEL